MADRASPVQAPKARIGDSGHLDPWLPAGPGAGRCAGAPPGPSGPMGTSSDPWTDSHPRHRPGTVGTGADPWGPALTRGIGPRHRPRTRGLATSMWAGLEGPGWRGRPRLPLRRGERRMTTPEAWVDRDGEARAVQRS